MSRSRPRPLRRAGAVGLALAAAGAASPSGAAARSGNPPAVDYQLHCAGCHQADGAGLSGGRVPDLAPVAAFLRVPGGREYLVQVPGVAQADLDDADLAALLNWMLEHFAGGRGDAPPYGAAEVSRLRRRALVDVPATRAALVAALGGAPAPHAGGP